MQRESAKRVAQARQMILQIIAMQPKSQRSDRAIGRLVGLHNKTVRALREGSGSRVSDKALTLLQRTLEQKGLPTSAQVTRLTVTDPVSGAADFPIAHALHEASGRHSGRARVQAAITAAREAKELSVDPWPQGARAELLLAALVELGAQHIPDLAEVIEVLQCARRGPDMPSWPQTQQALQHAANLLQALLHVLPSSE